MLQKLKRFGASKTIKKFFKIILFILSLNVLIAVLGPYLSVNLFFFSDKSAVHIMSDLLFLEGAVIFAVAAFLKMGTAYYAEEKAIDSPEGSNEKHMSPEVLYMVVGASLIGLSIIIGVFI